MGTKNMYVWQVSLQVTSPERPALRHDLQYRVQALSNERDAAIQKARDAATREGHTVVSVTGAACGHKILETR
jgi:hypothetical protein